MASGVVTFYIDGVSVATSAIIPTEDPDNLMRPLIGIRADSAFLDAKAFTADYIYFEIYGD